MQVTTERPERQAPAPGLLARFIQHQAALSRRFDRLFPEKYRRNGVVDFKYLYVPFYLTSHLRVYDIGGGKNPYLPVELKAQLHLEVIGVDIDREELDRAPAGAYDRTVCADICRVQATGDADLVICKCVLEHVRDVAGAFRAIAGLLKPGGKALLFVPSRNALYARLNLLLPQRTKERLLYGIFPSTRKMQGFPSYYDHCTPRDFRRLAETNGMMVEAQRLYFTASYCSFFFPLHILVRLWGLLFHLLAGDQAAETFAMTLRKQDERE